MRKQAGISVIELILVILVIGILTALVIVSRNPASQESQTRNIQRQSDIEEIAQTIHQFKLHNQNRLPKTNDRKKIAECQEDTTDTSDLSDALVSDYLTEIPIDPQGQSQYLVCQTDDDKITVKAPKAELGKEVTITR